MKKIGILCLMVAFSVTGLYAQDWCDDDHDHDFRFGRHAKWDDDDVKITFRHGHIRFKPKQRRYRGESVEMTDTYGLLVNGEPVKLSKKQRQMTETYYRKAQELVESAKAIGWEGAKVGMEGAKIGLYAVAGLVRLLDADYDTDDFERDMEREAGKIERKAERLEEEAEELEEIAEDLEDLREKMAREIPELKKLNWF